MFFSIFANAVCLLFFIKMQLFLGFQHAFLFQILYLKTIQFFVPKYFSL